MFEEGVPETGNPQQGRVIPSFEITEDLLTKAGAYVEESWRKFESQRTAKAEKDTNRKSWRDRLVQADRAYRGILEPDRSYKGFDDKCSPIVNDNTEAIVSRLKGAILFTREQNLVKLKYNSPNVQIRQDEINNQFEKQEIEDKVDRFVRQCVKFGTGLIKVPLINEERAILTQQMVTIQDQVPIVDDSNTQIMNPANGMPMFHVETRQEVQIVPQVDRKYFGPGYVVLNDVEDLYADAFIENIQDQPIVVHKYLMSYETLMDGVNKGVYFKDKVDQIKDAPAKTLNPLDTSYVSRKERVFGQNTTGFGSLAVKQGKPKEFLLYEAWCDFEIDSTDEEGNKIKKVYPCVITVCNSLVIGLGPNPYFHQMKPFVKGTYRRIEGEFYGMSAIDPILGLFHAYNDTLNQTEDNKVLKLNGVTVVKAGSINDKQDYNVGPGEIWYERDQGDIRPYVIEFPMAEAQQYLDLLEQKINRGMGVTPLMQGATDSTDLEKTWRGANKLVQESEKKFKDIAIGLEEVCIRQTAEFFLKVNIQFNPIQTDFNVFEVINSEVGIVVEGVEAYFETQEKIQTYGQFGMQAAQIPGFNVPGIMNTIAEMQRIEIDPKWGPLYTPPPPPPPPSKPVNVSVNMPIDMSKGPAQFFTGAQLLKEQGIDLNVDSIAEATKYFTDFVDPKTKAESGLLPPAYDSYQKGKNKE